MHDLKNIWLCSPGFGIGSEVWMYRQASGMANSSVTVLTRKWLNAQAPPTATLDVHVIPDGNSWLTKLLRPLDIATGVFPLKRRNLAWFDRIYEATQPQVMLCHYGTTGRWAFPLAKRYGIPMAVHFNGHDLSSSLNKPLYRKWLERSISGISAFVVVANYMRDWLLAAGADERRIHYIPYGVPDGDLEQAKRLDDAECRFLAVGRLVDKKRPDLTIRAFERCVRANANSTLTLIGDGPLMAKCERITGELGISDKVSFLGLQPNQEVRRMLAEASVFVQHSVTAESGDMEGWPVAIGEAAGCGLPIISTRHASIPEQVLDGVSGILVDEGDWEAMGAAMSELAADASKRVRMGAAAFEHMRSLSTSGQIEKLENVLHGLVGA